MSIKLSLFAFLVVVHPLALPAAITPTPFEPQKLAYSFSASGSGETVGSDYTPKTHRIPPKGDVTITVANSSVTLEWIQVGEYDEQAKTWAWKIDDKTVFCGGGSGSYLVNVDAQNDNDPCVGRPLGCPSVSGSVDTTIIPNPNANGLEYVQIKPFIPGWPSNPYQTGLFGFLEYGFLRGSTRLLNPSI